MGIETCVGLRQQAAPDAAIVATAMEAMVAEAVLAERAGFHSIRAMVAPTATSLARCSC